MNPRIKTKSVLLGLCLALSAPIAVADVFNATQVETLRKQGKAQQAYELALKYRDQLEGDPGYDFYYGLAAIDAGKLSEGVLALERVVLTTPENTLAHLELARGYFLLKEDTRARQEFETVLTKNPPAAVVANVKSFLKIIRLRESQYTSTASAYVQIAIGHDSNISSSPANSTFFSPLLNLIVTSGTEEENDDYLTVTTGGQLVHPFAPGKQLILGADVSGRFNSDDETFNTETWSIHAGIKWRKGDDNFGIRGQVQEFELNDVDSRSLISLSGDWTRRLNKQTNWSSQLQVAQIGYPTSSSRDSSLYILGTGLTHQYDMKWQPTLSANIYLGIEDAHTDTEAARALAQRNFEGVRVAGQIIPTSNMSLSASLSYETSHYEGENSFTGITRNDRLYQASLTGRYLVDDNWSLGAGIYYTRNDSNTVTNDYDQTRSEISARYTF
ncbi:MAG: DUF560 domain-containing protein [Proteobacteria bacterium]|nr:DUF560 domain-containing protein [Pseudomonadota bacterium]